MGRLARGRLEVFVGAAEAEVVRRAGRNRLKGYAPYAKQAEFHRAGAGHRERLFMAGNQLGKTVAGAAEVAMHLTGLYPEGWEGFRFDRPGVWICASESAELTRDGVQRLLLGPPSDSDAWGTGFIPADCLVETSRRAGVPDAVATCLVRHVGGGHSTVLFKSYDQGRSKWQANTIDGVWFDEEPPLDVYSEGLTRTNATFGPVIVTFTPLKGMSDVVVRFLMPDAKDEGQADRCVVRMTIDDAGHYTDEQKRRVIAAYPEHEREARVRGVPIMGSGRVFPVAEADVAVEPFVVPGHWVQLGGMDFGWDHPFAAVGCAWDRDADVFYVTRCYRQREQTPVIHAAALRPWGAWLPWAWPHDGLQHDKGSGEALKAQYEAQGLVMLSERASFEDGGNGVEAGVLEMLDRMKTGRWKVFSTCGDWFEEFRLYHRDGGMIVKVRDDLLSASRYAYMMRRDAVVQPVRRALVLPGYGVV